MARMRRARLTALLALGVLLPAAAPSAQEPETLLEVYRQAIEADPELRGQALEHEALAAEQRAALGALLPSAQISAEIRHTDREETRAAQVGAAQTHERTFTQEQYMANLTQPLFNLPAWHEWQGSQRSADAGQAELEARRQALIHQVAEAYLEVLNAQSTIRLQEKELEAVQASLEQAEALHEAEEAARSELAQARARRDNVRAALIRARGEAGVAREELSKFTGQEHGPLSGLRADAELPPLEPEALESWLEHAYAGNPQIAAARAELQAQGRQAQAASARRYPTVNLTGGYTGFDDAGDVDLNNPDDAEMSARELDDYYVGVQVQMPLFEGGAINARARSAERRHDRQREEVERIRRSVRNDARSAYESIVSARSEIAAYRAAVRSGERSVAAMEAEVEAGTRAVTDLLEAQRERFEAQRNLAEARHKYLVNTLQLRRAAGHLGSEDVRALNRLFSKAEAGGGTEEAGAAPR